MRKQILHMIFVIFVLMIWTTPAAEAASPADTVLKQGIEGLDTSGVDQYWQKLMNDYGGFFPDSQGKSVFELIMPGGEGIHPEQILKGLLKYIFHEIIYSGKLLASIIVLTVFAIILESIQNAFEQSTVSRVAYAISYMVLIIMAVNSFHVAVSYGQEAIQKMVEFMLAIIPLMMTLLASTGSLTSVALFHPLVIFMVHIIGTMIYTLIFPLIFFSAVLNIVSSFSVRYQVTQLARLMRTVSLGLLGVSMTVFLTILSIEGATGAMADGFTVRTAKYITSNFVPVVGRVIADASETIVGASLLVKNAVGIVGVIILLMICAFPALKIIALAFIYSFAAAILQPLGSSPIIDCLQTIGKSLMLVFAALAVVGLMFFLALTIIITAGNVSVMMR